MCSLFLTPGNFKHKSIPCDQINRFREWMGILVTAFLPFLPAALAHSTLRCTYGTYKGNRVLSCKWSNQLPLLQRLTLSLRQASCTPRPPGFHQGRWSGQSSFCFSSYPFKGVQFMYISQIAKQSHLILLSGLHVPLPLHASRGAYLMESGQT